MQRVFYGLSGGTLESRTKFNLASQDAEILILAGEKGIGGMHWGSAPWGYSSAPLFTRSPADLADPPLEQGSLTATSLLDISSDFGLDFESSSCYSHWHVVAFKPWPPS